MSNVGYIHDHDLSKKDVPANAWCAARSQQSFRTTFDRSITALRFLGTQGLQFGWNSYYGKQPMFWLPQGWVPYPAEWVLSFPRAPLGSISITIWGIACASVIAMVSEGIVAIWTLRTGEVKVGPKKGEKIKLDTPVQSGNTNEKKEL